MFVIVVRYTRTCILMKKILFVILLLILTMQLATASGYNNEIYIENEHFLSNNGQFEYINLGWKWAVNDYIDFHYTFGFTPNGTQNNFTFHYPASINIAPVLLVFDDNLGVSISLAVLSALIPEGISFKIPVDYSETIYVGAYTFPLTTDVIGKDEYSSKSISWSGSFGAMVQKEEGRFALRAKAGMKVNPATQSYGPQVGVSIGYLF